MNANDDAQAGPDPEILKAVAAYKTTYKPKQPVKVYIDVSFTTCDYEGAPSNVLSACLSTPDQPSLARQAVMAPYAAEVMTSTANGTSPKFKILTRTEGDSAVFEVVEPAGQDYLAAHREEIVRKMHERRYRPVVGIAYSRNELTQNPDWHTLYEVELVHAENGFKSGNPYLTHEA